MEKGAKVVCAQGEDGSGCGSVGPGVETRRACEVEKRANLIENVSCGTGVHAPAICEKLAFGPRVAGHAIDHVVKLLLNQLDFLPGALGV